MLGSYVQNEAVAEAQWWLAAAIGGHIAGQAFDALDDCLDARRLAKAADKAGDAAKVAVRAPQEEVRFFKSYRALKRGLGSPGEGNVWHHIVEQRGPNIARFGPEAIHNTQNVVAVPRQVNHSTASYYASKRWFTGEQTVRQWLGSQAWREQFEFGQKILNDVVSGRPLP
jgi:hypothetical protein